MSRRTRRLARWTRALAIAAPLAAIVALVAGAPAVLAALGRPSGQGFAGGYDRLVDAIAQRQWLAVRYDADGGPRIALRDGPVGRDPRLRAFVNASYLHADLQDPAIWRLSDDGQWVEGIDPYAHRIDLPFSGGGAWTGPILFRDGATPGLRLQPLGDPSPAPIRLEPQGAAASACDILMPTRRVSAPEPRRALSICLKDGAAPPHAVGSVILIGDQAVVRVQTPSILEIRIGARDVRPRADGDVTLTPLPQGETLTLRTGQSVLRLRLEGGTTRVAYSEPSGARAYFPALQPLAQPLERVMSGRPATPVRLSLDASLQQTAQDALVEGAATVRDSLPKGDKPAKTQAGDAFKAAVTVMDTTTGQVLAVASWPLAESELAPAQRRTRRGQNLVDQNHNFERLPVGSMAKGPFAFAILDADPGLATLKMQGGATGRVRTVLGMDLGKGGFDNHGLGLTDFPTFLERSNNRYALALMMLAYRDPAAPPSPGRGGAGEAWSLEGRSHTGTPPLPVFGEATAPGPYGWVLQPPPGRGPAWPDRLARLFDLDAGQGGGCRYDVAVWSGLTGAAPTCASPLAGASPERERLGFDAVASFRNDYLMAVLGGSRSTWSNIKMAEVYSRIVTGRQVRARFTVAGPPAAALPMRNPQVRGPMLEGLSRVVKSGTAARLGREFDDMGYGADVVLYGKTGTMKVAGEAPSEPGAALLRQLARSDCGLRWDAAAGVLKFGFVAPRDQADAARQILGLKETRCRVRVAGRRDLARQAAAEMQRYACGYRNCRPGDFTPEPDGRVVELPLRPVEPPLLDGHAIAVVAVRQVGGRPVRGLTIVVNLQDKRQAETPALAVAAAILRSPAARAWITGDGA